MRGKDDDVLFTQLCKNEETKGKTTLMHWLLFKAVGEQVEVSIAFFVPNAQPTKLEHTEWLKNNFFFNKLKIFFWGGVGGG